jgi:hypothetical protein
MNLVLLYPDYLYRGSLYASTTASSGFPASNVITGSRQLYYKSSSAVSAVNFDVNVSGLPANERACQYAYIGGFNLPVATIGQASITCTGASNSAISTATTIFTIADRQRDDLMGIAKEDFVMENPSPEARDFWRVSISRGSASGDHIFCVRQIMLGRWWYPGREPEAPLQIEQWQTSGRRSRRSLKVNWAGVSNLKLNEFMQRIAIHKEYSSVVLYARLNHSVLHNERLITCKLETFSIERVRHDVNNLTCDFLEII